MRAATLRVDHGLLATSRAERTRLVRQLVLVLLVLMLLDELVAHLLGDYTEVCAATLVHGPLVRRRHHTRSTTIVVVRRVDAGRLCLLLLVARVEHSRRSLSRCMTLAHVTVR